MPRRVQRGSGESSSTFSIAELGAHGSSKGRTTTWRSSACYAKRRHGWRCHSYVRADAKPLALGVVARARRRLAAVHAVAVEDARATVATEPPIVGTGAVYQGRFVRSPCRAMAIFSPSVATLNGIRSGLVLSGASRTGAGAVRGRTPNRALVPRLRHGRLVGRRIGSSGLTAPSLTVAWTSCAKRFADKCLSGVSTGAKDRHTTGSHAGLSGSRPSPRRPPVAVPPSAPMAEIEIRPIEYSEYSGATCRTEAQRPGPSVPRAGTGCRWPRA